MIWSKPSCASPFNFDKVLTAGRKVVHRILGPTAPPVASDSDAATRQQIQNNDITSSDPRLVVKIVARGSWFVARKSLPLCLNRLWSNLTSGTPSGRPLRTRALAVYFL